MHMASSKYHNKECCCKPWCYFGIQNKKNAASLLDWIQQYPQHVILICLSFSSSSVMILTVFLTKVVNKSISVINIKPTTTRAPFPHHLTLTLVESKIITNVDDNYVNLYPPKSVGITDYNSESILVMTTLS